MDRDPHPPAPALTAADGANRDAAGRQRAVAEEMGVIFAPLAAHELGAGQASPAVGHAAAVAARKRRSRPVRGMVLGVCVAVGAIGAAFVVRPHQEAPRQAMAPAAARSIPTPPIALAARAVDPVPDAAPARTKAETPGPGEEGTAAAPAPVARARARRHVARRTGERHCGRDCQRASELAAHRALERAYFAAADAGVSRDELAGYQRDWRRLRRRTSHDPRLLTREYNALADALYGRALEERSAPH